ncbi:MAG TPA: plastocyanin/azurin family copper-binding protein [Actinomycetota bacterium]|nr:plastocyanin/azurin family copper-binding protein [Actinomycetota bacterium]
MSPGRFVITVALVSSVACARGETPPDAPAPRDAGGDASSVAAGEAPSDDGPRRVDPKRGGLELGFGEYAITFEADEIRPGPVTFVIRNQGTMVHGFEIEIEEVDEDHSGPGGGGDDDGFKFEGEPLGPGDSAEIPMHLPAGLYKVECFVEGHDDLGMEGMLEVRPGAPLVRVETAPTGGDRVEIVDFGFSPTELEVPAGTDAVWVNADPTPHTVTADDGTFDSGTLDPGAEFSTRFPEVGTYLYICQIHPSMRGTVRVV